MPICSISVCTLTYQPRARHSSRCGRSIPSVVDLPCPGWTTVSSGYFWKSLVDTSSKSCIKSWWFFVFPIPPGKSESPTNKCMFSPMGTAIAAPPVVCPCRIWTGKWWPANGSTSESVSKTSTGALISAASGCGAKCLAPVCSRI